MPTSADVGPSALVDTSIAVALVTEDHAHHAEVFAALSGRRLGLAGHAAFETFSVLTRLPPPARRTPAAVVRLLDGNFPHTRHLTPDRAEGLREQLGRLGIAGGSVYDGLVAAAAVEHGLPLVSRDRRAMTTYRALGAEVELLA